MDLLYQVMLLRNFAEERDALGLWVQCRFLVKLVFLAAKSTSMTMPR